MAAPLKDSFGPEVPTEIAERITEVYPPFDQSEFLANALAGFDDLELTPRAWQVADALAKFLPSDPAQAVNLVTAALGPIDPDNRRVAMEGFFFLPLVFFVGRYGLDAYEESMQAQYELTQHFTAEFSIRPFLQQYPDRTLTRLHTWATDPNVHVRRLVSEGTRPRLPWAPRLPEFQRDPTPVLSLLEILKDDPEEYVRRSVANNLNDIAKDHPILVVEIAARWRQGADKNRKRLIRHALRTLVKQGDPGALAVLGYSPTSPARHDAISLEPAQVRIGEKIRLTVSVHNPDTAPTGALIDFVVHFVKASGTTSPKVFKGAELLLEPGETRTVSKLISVAQHSTRKHYPGTHRVSIKLNGIEHDVGSFELLAKV